MRRGRPGERAAARRVKGRIKERRTTERKKKRESRWQRGMTPPMHCTCSPPDLPSSQLLLLLPALLFKPLGALKWKNVSMLRLSTRRHTTRPSRDNRGPADTLFFLTNRVEGQFAFTAPTPNPPSDPYPVVPKHKTAGRATKQKQSKNCR